MTAYKSLVVLSICLVWGSSGLLFGAKRDDEDSMVSVVTIPVTKPTSSQTSNKHWCRDRTCARRDYCTSVVHPSASCCPSCGCTNQFGIRVNIGAMFRIETKDGICRQCQCVRTWVGTFSVCRKIPACRDVSTCIKKYKPPGQCCFVCQDKDDRKFRLPFPDIVDKK
ncbi:uncharacterized protein LOC130622772 [Hydractinia symbiolongicarpus]|uniref:uncharacterized protein LOC130622772 n=1 Tax=Hydractinia symbiolongicarpus TaxID=13093 RepID=UPI00254D2AE4|nr:uncharacterized protein LOC130622772 [Hydractinia symbiolongicarpus]